MANHRKGHCWNPSSSSWFLNFQKCVQLKVRQLLFSDGPTLRCSKDWVAKEQNRLCCCLSLQQLFSKVMTSCHEGNQTLTHHAFYVTHIRVGCVKSKPLWQCGRDPPWLKAFKPKILLSCALFSLWIQLSWLLFPTIWGWRIGTIGPPSPSLTSSPSTEAGSFKNNSRIVRQDSNFPLRRKEDTSSKH